MPPLVAGTLERLTRLCEEQLVFAESSHAYALLLEELLSRFTEFQGIILGPMLLAVALYGAWMAARKGLPSRGYL